MVGFLLVAAVVVLLSGAVLAALGGRLGAWDSAAIRSARRLRLATTAALLPAIARRERRMILAGTVGAALGLAGAAAALAAAPPPPGAEGIEALSGILAGGAVAAAVAAALDARVAVPPGPRVARVRAVTLVDYLPRLERVAARICGWGAPLAAIADVTARGARADLAVPVGLAALALFGVLLLELEGRRLVSRPQPVRDELALAWDDVLRARALLAMATAPIAAGGYSLLLVVAGAAESATDVLDLHLRLAVLGSLLLVVLPVAIVLLVIAVVRRPQRHVLARLWPLPSGSAR